MTNYFDNDGTKDLTTPPTMIDDFLKSTASRIKLRLTKTVKNVLEVGRDLLAVKERLGHGHFLKWIDNEFKMSADTAARFMTVARNMADQIPQGAEYQLSVLYALAAPSTPTSVRAFAHSKAAKGETVTLAEVKALKVSATSESNKRGSVRTLSSAQDHTPPPTLEDLSDRARETIMNAVREIIRSTSPAATDLWSPESEQDQQDIKTAIDCLVALRSLRRPRVHPERRLTRVIQTQVSGDALEIPPMLRRSKPPSAPGASKE